MDICSAKSLDIIIGPIRLPLKIDEKVQHFQLYYFESKGQRWACAKLGDLVQMPSVPLRIESACFFGHVMHSQQCDCSYQLDEALRRIVQKQGGLVIYGIDQDARGLGIEKHFQIYDYRQNHHMDTAQVYQRFHAPLDSRSYEDVAAILRFLSVSDITLMSNNPERLAFFTSQGFGVTREAIEAPLTTHNMATMMQEKEDLKYQWSFRTHADWLTPLQELVEARPQSYAACAVHDNREEVARWQGDSWDVAQGLLNVMGDARHENLVIYLSDLPRLDELTLYAGMGAHFVVVPFSTLPTYLKTQAARLGLKLQDWERHNPYSTARPQWLLTQCADNQHVYQRDNERQVVQCQTPVALEEFS